MDTELISVFLQQFPTESEALDHADYFITRNVRGYQPAPIQVFQPVELLAVLKS